MSDANTLLPDTSAWKQLLLSSLRQRDEQIRPVAAIIDTSLWRLAVQSEHLNLN